MLQTHLQEDTLFIYRLFCLAMELHAVKPLYKVSLFSSDTFYDCNQPASLLERMRETPGCSLCALMSFLVGAENTGEQRFVAMQKVSSISLLRFV